MGFERRFREGSIPNVSLIPLYYIIHMFFLTQYFFRKINNTIETLPLDFCKFKVLPELIKALEFGGAGAKALNPILKISGRLNDSEFDKLIVPIIVKLFSTPDRAVRVSLCENLPIYINHLSQSIVSDKIFPNLSSGFGDTNAIVREITLKSILVIIPKLSEKIINNDLLRYLAKLQADEEPGIRTNTTICIGKLSKFLTDAVKKKVLVSAFIRSLNDSFPPSRNAGLMAFLATIDHYQPSDMAQKILPAVSPLLLDTEKSIRNQALKLSTALLKKIEMASEQMPESASSGQSEGSKKATSGSEAASSDGWAGWAISAVSSTIRQTTLDDSSKSVASSGPSAPVSPTKPAPPNAPPTFSQKPLIPMTSHSYTFETPASNRSSISASQPLPSNNVTAKPQIAFGSTGAEGWGDDVWDDFDAPSGKKETNFIPTLPPPPSNKSKSISKKNTQPKNGWDDWNDF